MPCVQAGRGVLPLASALRMLQWALPQTSAPISARWTRARARRLSNNRGGGFWHFICFCAQERSGQATSTPPGRPGQDPSLGSTAQASQPTNPVSCVWFMKTERCDPGDEGLVAPVDSSNKRGDGSSVFIVAGGELGRGTRARPPLCTPSK